MSYWGIFKIFIYRKWGEVPQDSSDQLHYVVVGRAVEQFEKRRNTTGVLNGSLKNTKSQKITTKNELQEIRQYILLAFNLVLVVLASVTEIAHGAACCAMHFRYRVRYKFDERWDATEHARLGLDAIVHEAQVLEVGCCIGFDVRVGVAQELDCLRKRRVSISRLWKERTEIKSAARLLYFVASKYNYNYETIVQNYSNSTLEKKLCN